MALRALICDLDMTLIDSRGDIAAALAHAGRVVLGREWDEAAIAPLIGQPLLKMATTLAPDATPAQAAECFEEYKRFFYDHCCDRTTIYPGVVETLAELGRRGVKRAVATTKMTFMAKRVCAQLGLAPLLDFVQGTEDFPEKPDPEVIRRVCAALRIEPREAAFVGDTVMDVAAARRAGCVAVAASWGIGRRDELLAAGPDALLGSFGTLLGIFDGGVVSFPTSSSTS
jgi:phosphoglycolate phosphatase